MKTETNNILTVDELTTVFQTGKEIFTAVDNISFSLRQGEPLGIVGESGSGKSVTSLSLMRLIQSPPGKIAGGSALFINKAGNTLDLFKLTDKDIRKYRGNEIAMIFQETMTSI